MSPLCTPDQIVDEVKMLIAFQEVYGALLDDVRLSYRQDRNYR